MYYRLSDDVLFRRYENFGYISDNSEYGYRMLNDSRSILGEKYVSESGAVMLEQLSREPQEISEIVKKLIDIFVDVDFGTLLSDTEEFFAYLASDGFVS